jgi:hypothetical protein
MLLLPLLLLFLLPLLYRFVNMLLIVCIPRDIEYGDLFANSHFFESSMNAESDDRGMQNSNSLQCIINELLYELGLFYAELLQHWNSRYPILQSKKSLPVCSHAFVSMWSEADNEQPSVYNHERHFKY